jgi:hypothetical protein
MEPVPAALLKCVDKLTSPNDAIPDHLMPQTLLNPKGLSDTQSKPARRKERAGSQLLDSRMIVFMTATLAKTTKPQELYIIMI